MIKQSLFQSRCFPQTIVWSTFLSNNLDCLINQLFDQHICWSNNLERLIQKSVWSTCLIKHSRLFDQQPCWSNNCLINQSRLLDQNKQLFDQPSRLLEQKICWSSNCLINVKIAWSKNMLLKKRLRTKQ